jgi:D-alanyl-D-alanine carboxypeptidase/D-alanyl-D-alanine-endopeptidase (penicillin-binding protein 4)
VNLRAGLRRWAWLALLALIADSARAELPSAVSQALRQAGIPESHVGIVVQEIGNPIPLLAHGEKRSFNPASVMKLVTTLVALDSLGPAYTFKTRVYADGPIVEGVLRGNLILQGGGDPVLTLERFWQLLRELRERGVREIRGDVLLDGRYYQLDPIDPGAFDQSPLRPYNAPPSALLVNFNTLNLRLKTVDGALSARLDPPQLDASPALINLARISDAPCNGWREKIAPQVENNHLVLSGSFSSACGEQSMPLNLLSPEATLAAVFGAIWKDLGGIHGGQVLPVMSGTELAVNAPLQLLLEFDSPPLSQQVRDINKFSNNVMAKMLFLNLGAARFGAPATWDKGERAVRGWFKERGLEMPELVLENGSGLSRIERISAASLTSLLSYAAASPAYYEFAASLPAVGLEGTQKGRMPDAMTLGAAWLKSGTLNGARNLAGYTLGRNGARRILVMLINHANAAAGAKAQEALTAWAMQRPASP